MKQKYCVAMQLRQLLNESAEKDKMDNPASKTFSAKTYELERAYVLYIKNMAIHEDDLFRYKREDAMQQNNRLHSENEGDQDQEH